ncbi:hypothetical protein GCM10011390_28670 [Aureimonas endophytica]|uniref:Protein ImuA n=1 Tax=Aureimonas endophytica TaxID=2027858 RepID=A0A916ZPL4_9HYPH|nr:hypothetical protein [Aureimonas endophytica]GGE07909.1 hypothetical protein GCM10011390_28670 [Aureimonas endophytica]
MAFTAVEDGRERAAARPAEKVAALRAALARLADVPDAAAEQEPLQPLGLPALDAALGGGLPGAGLSELHGDETRGIGAATGFALALAVLRRASARRPLLWIGTALSFGEAGALYGPGLAAAGLDPAALFSIRTRRLVDAVWAAEEAVRSGLAALTVLEARGNPPLLELEGTRRLHLRAQKGGAPLLLLRQGGRAEPTAAPLRLRIAAHGSRPPPEFADLARLVGRPAFALAIEKSRAHRFQQVLVEWNAHDRRFELAPDDRRRADPGPALAAPADGPAATPGARPRLALGRRRS